jgi:membrane-bound lytic murein transglycosylase B
MLDRRLRTWHKAMTLVPLALLSGAGTAEFSAVSATTAERAATPDAAQPVATQAIAVPPPELTERADVAALGVPAGSADRLLKTVPNEEIPPAALLAYQRASQVLASADRGCKLSWQLVAAVGRVESDHGRYGGNRLSEDGRSRPGIFGVPLDGSGQTARILDTDAGAHDNDRVYDRAVGPMQFIPSTWSVVGVDGDGDGVRDPQDIDDAALASAVYLCSGDEDLSTVPGQRAAVYRYNHSRDYVDLVLAIMEAYLEGDYSTMPTAVDVGSVALPSGPAQVVTPGDVKTPDANERGARDKSGHGDDRDAPPENEPHESNSRVESGGAKSGDAEPKTDEEPSEPKTEEAAPESDMEAAADDASSEASEDAGDETPDAVDAPVEPEGDSGEGGASDADDTAVEPDEAPGDEGSSEADDASPEPDVEDDGASEDQDGAADPGEEAIESSDSQDSDVTEDVIATPTALPEAQEICESLLTAAEIEGLGGLTACAHMVLDVTAGEADTLLPARLVEGLRHSRVDAAATHVSSGETQD